MVPSRVTRKMPGVCSMPYFIWKSETDIGSHRYRTLTCGFEMQRYPDMNSSIGFAAVLNDFDGQKRTRLPFFHGVDNLNDAKNGMGKIKFYLK